MSPSLLKLTLTFWNRKYKFYCHYLSFITLYNFLEVMSSINSHRYRRDPLNPPKKVRVSRQVRYCQ